MTSIYRERRLSLASIPNETISYFSSTKPVTLKLVHVIMFVSGFGKIGREESRAGFKAREYEI